MFSVCFNSNNPSWILFADSIGLHRVENLSNINPAVSLHLYCPPYSNCHVFNELTGQSTLTKVTFWSKFGEKRDKVRCKILLTIKYKVWLLELQFKEEKDHSMSTQVMLWYKFPEQRNKILHLIKNKLGNTSVVTGSHMTWFVWYFSLPVTNTWHQLQHIHNLHHYYYIHPHVR